MKLFKKYLSLLISMAVFVNINMMTFGTTKINKTIIKSKSKITTKSTSKTKAIKPITQSKVVIKPIPTPKVITKMVKGYKITLPYIGSGIYSGWLTNNKTNGYGAFEIDSDKKIIYEGTWNNNIFLKGKITIYDCGQKTVRECGAYVSNGSLVIDGDYKETNYIDENSSKPDIIDKGYYNKGQKSGMFTETFYDNGVKGNSYYSWYKHGQRIYTLDDYKNLYTNMTLSSAELYLDKGTLTSSYTNSIGDETYKDDIYEWGDLESGQITILFENGKAQNINQFGLKSATDVMIDSVPSFN